MHSPSPTGNHNTSNHHSDTEKNFTYATHKLPNFTEMITLHKSKNATVSSFIKYESDPLAISNNNNVSDDSTINVSHHQSQSLTDDVFDTNLSMAGELVTTLVDTTTSECAPNGSTVDIMNMDIIFDNAPIEVDTSIGNTSNTTIDGDVIERAIITPTFYDKVHINGETYEIVTLNESTSSNCNITSDSINANVDDDANGSVASVEPIDSANINFMVDSVHLSGIMEMSSSNVIADVSEPLNITPTMGISNIESNQVATEANGSAPVVVPQIESIEPIERATVSGANEEENDIFAELASTTKTVEAEKERAARELEERRRKRKPVPVLAIKYKRRRKLSTNDGQAESLPLVSKEPMDLSIEKGQTDEEPIRVDTMETAEVVQSADQIEPEQQPVDLVVGDLEPMTSSKMEPEPETDAVEREHESVVPDESNEVEQTNDSDEQSNFMNSLVVVESQDPDDPARTIYAVHIVDPVTKVMSEQPLDLPDDVIQRIRQSM